MVREYGTDAYFELSCGLALAGFAVAPAALYTAPAQQIVSPFTSATPTSAARVQGLNSGTSPVIPHFDGWGALGRIRGQRADAARRQTDREPTTKWAHLMEGQFVFGGHGSETSRDRSLISTPQDQWTIRFSRRGASRSAITYPNGKIYVGMDLTGSVTYFGSPSAKERIAADLGDHAHEYTARKQIFWESDTDTDAEVRAMEVTLIGSTG